MLTDPDRELAEAFLAGCLDGKPVPTGGIEEPSKELLIRRHSLSRTEAAFLDVWREAIDASEIVIATLNGLLSIGVERFGDREVSDDERLAWMLVSSNSSGCLYLADDVLRLVRRYSTEVAFAAFRVHAEISAKTRLLLKDHSLAQSFAMYGVRNRWSNSATANFALKRAWSPAGKLGSDARKEADKLTRDFKMLRSDDGWAHEYLKAHDSRYQSLERDGKRKDGPNLRDIERGAGVEPQFRALRAQANPSVHGNRIQIAPSAGDQDQEIGLLLITIISASTILCLEVFRSFDLFGDDQAAIAKSIAVLTQRASQSVVAAGQAAEQVRSDEE